MGILRTGAVRVVWHSGVARLFRLLARPLRPLVRPFRAMTQPLRRLARRLHVDLRSKRQRFMALAMAAAVLAGVLIPIYGAEQKAKAATWWNPSWSYRRTITFTNSASSTNLVNFPVRVSLTTSNFTYANAQSAGQDIRFTDSDGVTPLPYEIENWTNGGTSELWVKVPQIDASSNTDFIYMYYGNASANDNQQPAKVWDNDYKGVWHLKEDPSGTAPQIKDSTVNAVNGTANGSMTSANLVAGQIKNGASFNGTTQYYDMGNSPALFSPSFTVEAWFKLTSNPAASKYIFTDYDSTGTLCDFALQLNSSNTLSFWFENPSGTAPGPNNTTTTITTNTWYHVVGTYDGTSRIIYINGAAEGTPDNTAQTHADVGGNATIGRQGSRSSSYFPGVIDEVRYSDIARSADWIKANHLNDVNTFSTVSAQSAGTYYPDGQWTKRRKITFNNTASATNLTNFPVRVSLSAAKGNADYTDIQNFGQDLRFVDSDNSTALPYEIENYNESGTSDIWVKVPQIDAGSVTDYIYMYYGNSAVFDAQTPASVWDSNFRTVYHMDDSNATTTIDDSTDLHDGSKAAAGNPFGTTTAQIGSGQSFNGTSTDYVSSNGSATDANLQSGNFTQSFWFRPGATFTVGSATQELFALADASSINDQKTYLDGLADGNSGKLTYVMYTTAGASMMAQSTLSSWQANTWYFVTATYSTTAGMNLYINGTSDGTNNNTQRGTTNATTAFIGKLFNNTNYFNGGIDELRLSNTARSADWVKAEYLTDTDQMSTYGNEESQSGGTSDAWCNATSGITCDSNWAFRRRIELVNVPSSTTLASFPVLIKLNASAPLSNIDYANTQNGGQDIRFVDGSNNAVVLPHEIETWNESGDSYVWVSVPSVLANSNSDYIWMYYGNTTAADGQQPASVWDSNYKGVWHLKQDPSVAGSGGILDSTGNANNGTSNGSMTSGDQVAAKIAGGLDFDGVDDNVDAGDINALDGLSKLTIEAWIKPSATADYQKYIGKQSANNSRWSLSSAGTFDANSDDLYAAVGNGADSFGYTTGNVLANGSWLHAVMVFDGTQTGNANRLKVYVNGNQQTLTFGTNAIPATLPSNAATVTFGGSANYYAGILDEVRASDSDRSADWIKAEYNSTNNTMNTIGSETSGTYTPDGSWTYRRKIIFNNVPSSSNLTNFPVRVSLSAAKGSITYANTQSAGQDIRFVDSDDSTPLSYEIEKWDSSGTSEAWVKVPQIDAGTVTDFIYMYYGNATTLDMQSKTSVWDSNTQAVYHSSESNAASTMVDSTSSAFNMGMNFTSASTSGKIAGDQFYDGGNAWSNIANVGMLKNVSQATLTAWAALYDNGNTSKSVMFVTANAASTYRARMYFDVNNKLNCSARAGDAESQQTVTTSSAISGTDLVYHHVACVINYATDSIVVYIDGVAQATTGTVAFTGTATSNTNATDVEIANSDYPGHIDEPRISTTVRSADWINAEYRTGNDQMNTFAPQESRSGATSDSWCNDASGVTCDTNWNYRRLVEFINVPTSQDLGSFPVMIKLSAALGNVDYSKTQNNGEDIRFVDPSDNTVVLNHEIEKWNESGESIVWVKVPQVDLGKNSDYIWMYYGNASAGSPAAQLGNNSHATGVWSNSYQGVWHLGEDPSGTAPQMKDSSANGYDGTSNGSMTSGSQVAGQVSGSLSFNGSTQYVDVGNDANLFSSSLSVEAWFKLTSNPAASKYIFSDYDSTGTLSSFALQLDSSNVLNFWFENPSGTAPGPNTTGALSVGTWYHVVGTYDGTTRSIYINGVPNGTPESSVQTHADVGGNTAIGRPGSRNGAYFPGIIDEVRYSSTARSAVWIQADNNNMLNYITTYGQEEQAPLPAPTLTAFSGQTSTTPTFQLRGTDLNSPTWLRYKIDVCTTSDCSAILRTVDQSSSQTGWSGQDANTGTAYTASATLASSTLASYTWQAPALTAGQTYWWRGYDVDNDGITGGPSAISSFTVSAAPAAPTLDFPTNGASLPAAGFNLRMRTSDANSDNVKYSIDICADSSCSSVVRTIDQRSLQTGWISQNAESGTAYTTGTTLSAAQQAIYLYQPPSLSLNTQYWWRAYAYDPTGSNLTSAASAIQSFTLSGDNVRIMPGSVIKPGAQIGQP